MKILVTGAAGFIGFHLSLALARLGFEVLGLDNINDYYDIQLKLGRLKASGIDDQTINYNQLCYSQKLTSYRFIKLDLCDEPAMKQLFDQERFDVVCNLAAQAGVRYSLQAPHAYTKSNIEGFLNILECCRHFHIKHLVYASSSSVYGLNSTMPFDEDQPREHPISLYAASKKSNEMMAHSYAHLYRIPCTGLRFFTVYGPFGRPDMALFIFTKAILENKAINVFNNGQMMRDFTFVKDIIQALIKILQVPAKPDKNFVSNCLISNSSAPYKIYNIGNNNPVMLLDFIAELERALGQKAIKNFMPIQAGDVAKTYANVSKLVQDFDYRPSTPIGDGIASFVKWYKDFYRI